MRWTNGTTLSNSFCLNSASVTTPLSMSSLASASVIARGGYHKFFQRYGFAVFELCHCDSYLMILSARAKTFCGMISPICFAVLRFITSSSFVGCSTGRSAGLAPFRILST